MNLYPHQKEFLADNPSKALLTWEAGTGKTYVASLWLALRSTPQVVICPKQIKKKWQVECPDSIVYSFEEFTKAEDLPTPTTVVVDEADCMGAPLFIASKRSKRAEKLYVYLQENPQADVLLLTATPVRSTPWNMHSLLIYMGYANPSKWRDYQAEYFELKRMPYLPRPAYFPKEGWRLGMQRLINKHSYIALMKDIVDELPPELHFIIRLKAPNYDKNEEWEPAKQFVEDHRLEQSKKHLKIKEIAKGYRKAVVVSHYTQQIDELQKILSKERMVYVLDGRTKDADTVIKAAEMDPECYFIIQASVGAGFDLHTFSCMIFASQGYSVRDWVQMKARIRRIASLKKTVYYYLQAGRCDKMVYSNVQAGKDFIPSEYVRTTEEEEQKRSKG